MFPSTLDAPARRALLCGFASGFAALLFVRPSVARSELLLKETYVAGTRYYDADRAAPGLAVGEPLVLRREPTNPHDALAVEVLTRSGSKLGYVPRSDNEPFARLIDTGRIVTARVAAKRNPPFATVDVDLFLVE